MKRNLLLSILFLLIVGCEIKELERTVEVYGFDFSEYSKKGFLFTPETYNGPYESIGILKMIIYPEVRKKELKYENDPNFESKKYTDWAVGKINPAEAINEMYKSASKMGADAVTKFEIKTVTKINGQLIIEGIEVNGFAIKRK